MSDTLQLQQRTNNYDGTPRYAEHSGWEQGAAGAGAITATVGVAIAAIGAYYAADAAKSQMEARASALRFQARLADMNARRGEERASALMRDAQREREIVGLRIGQEASSLRVDAAARGVQIGVGSAAEVTASKRIMGEIDKRTISRNAVRQAGAVRAGAVNERIRGTMLRSSAYATERSASSISPGTAAATEGLRGAANVGPMWADYARRY